MIGNTISRLMICDSNFRLLLVSEILRLQSNWNLISLWQGCLTPVKVTLPPGSILDPSPTAAVVGGNVLTCQRIVDVVLRAFEVCAASQVSRVIKYSCLIISFFDYGVNVGQKSLPICPTLCLVWLNVWQSSHLHLKCLKFSSPVTGDVFKRNLLCISRRLRLMP